MPTLKEIILTTGREQIPQLNQANPEEVNSVVENALKMADEFSVLAGEHPHPRIYEDTDIVWVVPGPGVFSKEVTPLSDRYMHLPWSRKMDRVRIRTASAIFRQVTSLRGYPPVLIYTGTPDQNENFRAVLSKLSDKYKLPPEEKVHLIGEIKNPDGSFRDSYNSIDAVESLSFPEGITPRRMVIVSSEAHLVRILHILGKFHHSLPETTIVQPYPVSTPEEGRLLYTEMEVRGTLAAIYGSNSATPQPYPYQIIRQVKVP